MTMGANDRQFHPKSRTFFQKFLRFFNESYEKMTILEKEKREKETHCKMYFDKESRFRILNFAENSYFGDFGHFCMHCWVFLCS